MRRRVFSGLSKHVGVAAFEARLAFDGPHLDQIRGKPEQQLLAEVDVGDFASAELHHGFDAITFLRNRMAWFFLKS